MTYIRHASGILGTVTVTSRLTRSPGDCAVTYISDVNSIPDTVTVTSRLTRSTGDGEAMD